MHPLLQLLQGYSFELQVDILVNAIHVTTHQMLQLTERKLLYVEQGLVDSWEYLYAGYKHHCLALRTALEELVAKEIDLPSWMAA
ncbi:hypothetical protein [Hymenobacter pini]|uniref:hypothetical protein n=1 Tax=Hymenobacter pini TaxID=2880879 RepID=UPI001CF14666|nr:hypothetical protein [Hymenobacter pini]MCA8831946.1 hypothetical protein [Hymenobacter pini]